MSTEGVWREKTDEEVAAAAQRLDEGSEGGRQGIAAEVQRRGLQASGAVSAGVEGLPGSAAVGSEAQAPEVELSEAEVELVRGQLRSEQNLPAALIAGLVGAAIGAGVWAAITVATQFQIGWMAVGVGFLVGFAVRIAGKGIDKSFGAVGAGFALLGCLAGNLLAVCGLIANQEEMAFLDVLSQVDLGIAGQLMVATFSPMDLLFYGFAIYEGYRFSFRRVTGEEVMERLGKR